MLVMLTGCEETKNLVPYKILNKSEMGTIKVSFDVEVGVVDDRLPNENELAAISEHLIKNEQKHDRSFVVFYLPKMKIGAGGFATAHHNPKMEVKIMKYMLMQYPQYKKYSK